VAKRDLKAGEHLDGVGRLCTYGLIDDTVNRGPRRSGKRELMKRHSWGLAILAVFSCSSGCAHSSNTESARLQSLAGKRLIPYFGGKSNQAAGAWPLGPSGADSMTEREQ